MTPCHTLARCNSTIKDPGLEPLDAVWHLLNFFAPAAGLGGIASALAKLFWRSELERVSWLRLWGTASGCAAVVLVTGLVAFGHDGRLATYGAMAIAAALSLWWVGFRPFRR
ncbi:MAG: hypothetical protein M3Y67_02200 [Pseudomonadota bacterium]|nr:hypothetical protein [Pseudomonadota bacterium]